MVCTIDILKTVTLNGLILPLMNFYGLTSSPNFLFYFDPSPILDFSSFSPWSVKISSMFLSYYTKHVVTILWSFFVFFVFLLFSSL
jgi:hypothetical protein